MQYSLDLLEYWWKIFSKYFIVMWNILKFPSQQYRQLLSRHARIENNTINSISKSILNDEPKYLFEINASKKFFASKSWSYLVSIFQRHQLAKIE